MRPFYLVLSLALAGPGVAATVYKWVDEEGVVHYADRQTKEAEPVRIPGLGGAPPTSADEAEVAYAQFEFVRPASEEQIDAPTGEVPVGILLKPALHPTHSIQLSIDGVPVATPIRATQLTLTGVAPGTHSLSAVILRGDGEVLLSAPAVSFSLPDTANPPQATGQP
jgi:hypothetical protein